MPRIIVSADPVGSTRNKEVLLDEEVTADVLDDGHAAVQLLERMEMAIRDARIHGKRIAETFAATPHTEVPQG